MHDLIRHDIIHYRCIIIVINLLCQTTIWNIKIVIGLLALSQNDIGIETLGPSCRRLYNNSNSHNSSDLQI